MARRVQLTPSILPQYANICSIFSVASTRREQPQYSEPISTLQLLLPTAHNFLGLPTPQLQEKLLKKLTQYIWEIKRFSIPKVSGGQYILWTGVVPQIKIFELRSWLCCRPSWPRV